MNSYPEIDRLIELAEKTSPPLICPLCGEFKYFHGFNVRTLKWECPKYLTPPVSET